MGLFQDGYEIMGLWDYISPGNQSNEKFTGSFFDFKRSIPLSDIMDPKL